MKYVILTLSLLLIVFSVINPNFIGNNNASIGGIFKRFTSFFLHWNYQAAITPTPLQKNTKLPTKSILPTRKSSIKINNENVKTVPSLSPSNTVTPNSFATASPSVLPTTSSTPTPVKISDIKNLIVYWNFDEGTGSTLYDSSPNGVSGTIMNVTNSRSWLDQGKFGKALEFDGYDDYIYFQNVPTINLGSENQSYSISIWVRRNGNPAFQSGIISKNSGTGKYPFALTIQKDGRVAFSLFDGKNLAKIVSDDPIADNEWKHIVAVRDGTNKQLKLYVNDKQMSSIQDSTVGVLKNEDYVLIARYPFGDGSFFHDSFDIDETRIYGSSLTEAEVKALYDAGNSKISFFGYLFSMLQKLF